MYFPCLANTALAALTFFDASLQYNAYGGYHAVYVPTEEDDLHVHDFIIEVIAP